MSFALRCVACAAAVFAVGVFNAGPVAAQDRASEPSIIAQDQAETMVSDYIERHYSDFLPENARLEVDFSKALRGRPLAVRQLEFDQGMETFAAVVLTSFGHEILPGSVKALIEVPAPRDRVRAGTTLTADMFSTIAIDALSTDRDYVAALSQLVGKQARRSLSPGKPVRADYVSQPTVVRADELIRLVYETNQVRITVKGKALEDGAVGETIRVVNVRSNKTLTGIVRGPSQVAVAY